MNCFVNYVLYVCWCVKSLGKLLKVLKNCHSDHKKNFKTTTKRSVFYGGL